jgi:SAM-dependent methyltransferase
LSDAAAALNGQDGEVRVPVTPSANYPSAFGKAAVAALSSTGDKSKQKILLINSSTGRAALELLAGAGSAGAASGCSPIHLDVTDPTANNLEVLQSIFANDDNQNASRKDARGRIQWYQQLEGEVVELREFQIADICSSESSEDTSSADPTELFLKKKGGVNSVEFIQERFPTNMKSRLDGYDAIVADFRYKNVAEELLHVCTRTTGPGSGLLVLGSLDAPQEVALGMARIAADATKEGTQAPEFIFEQVADGESPAPVARYCHVLQETFNKHQFAVSWVSVWRRVPFDASETSKHSLAGLEAQAAAAAKTGKTSAVSEYSSAVHQKSQPKGQTNHSQETVTYYKDRGILDSYRPLHFSNTPINGIPNFPVAVAKVCIEAAQDFGLLPDSSSSSTAASNGLRAIDCGCGPGRTAFEFTKHFQHVEGFDYADGFVEMMVEEKDKYIANHANSTFQAYQGDAHCLLGAEGSAPTVKSPAGSYDLILGCNLIDRLHTPKAWVRDCRKMLLGEDGGAGSSSKNPKILVVASPYTWKPDHTATANWLGGFFDEKAERKFSVDGLKEELCGPDGGFELKRVLKVPFCIPDSDGTYQFTFSNVTVFVADAGAGAAAA